MRSLTQSGYLPAEHIETPTERLARLNKHRNIDLSASMLGDNTEKSKNPLKKAMRRRNAKTVQFTAPTYYEPSEIDFSDDEEGEGSQMDVDNDARSEDGDQSQQQEAENGTGQAAPTQNAATTNGLQRSTSHESLTEEPTSPDKAHGPESVDPLTTQDSVSRSRKGVVRNTDSFFKDDTAETKKISLTPRLLRGDSDWAGSAEQPEPRQRPSLETFDKMVGVEEKPGKEEKKKEKKGMLSGLFKRKDKTPKGAKNEERTDKVSEESLRPSTHSKESLDSVHRVDSGPERRPSKLQKQPPSTISPKTSPTETRAQLVPAPLKPQSQPAAEPVQQIREPQPSAAGPPPPTGPAPAPPTVRQVQQEDSQESLRPEEEVQTQLQPAAQVNRFPSLQEKRSVESDNTSSSKPVYAKQAKERFALDGSDSEDDQTPTLATPEQGRGNVSPLNDVQVSHQRNDSGMQISPIEPTTSRDVYPETTRDVQQPNHSNDYPEQEVTPIDAEGTASTSKASPSTVTTHTPSTSRSTPTWSDASLRTYLDNDQDIKDLLIIVHDKSNVVPVGQDHPLMANLFFSERNKLAEMQTQLDSMLMGWMSRKSTGVVSR